MVFQPTEYELMGKEHIVTVEALGIDAIGASRFKPKRDEKIYMLDDVIQAATVGLSWNDIRYSPDGTFDVEQQGCSYKVTYHPPE